MGYRIDVSLLPHVSPRQLRELAEVAERAVEGLDLVLRGKPDPERLPSTEILAFYQTVTNSPVALSIVSRSYTSSSHASRRWCRRLDEARLVYHRCHRGQRVHPTKIRQAQETLTMAGERLADVSGALAALVKRCHSLAEL